MIKRKEVKRLLYVAISLIALSLFLFSMFSFLTVKTNVNIIDNGIKVLKSLIKEPPGEVFSKISSGLKGIYSIVITETTILISAVLASLSALSYLIHLYFITREYSFIDELTQIYNRRALFAILSKEIKKARRFRHPLTVMMIDIDFFKVYNDNNGHAMGDMLLKKISKLILEEIRDVDTLARYGGEEFVVILPETSHKNATKVAERIRKRIERTYFKGEEKQPMGKLTISLGLVTFHGELKGKKKEQMIESADKLLYEAKKAGRNQLKKAYLKI